MFGAVCQFVGFVAFCRFHGLISGACMLYGLGSGAVMLVVDTLGHSMKKHDLNFKIFPQNCQKLGENRNFRTMKVVRLLLGSRAWTRRLVCFL